MAKWFYMALGGVSGVFARYLVSGAVYKKMGTEFPYGTLVVNLTGCFLIGLFNALAEEKLLLGANERILLMTGFCGAYTTFSTFILETSNLARDGNVYRGLLYVAASAAIGFLLFRLGALAARGV